MDHASPNPAASLRLAYVVGEFGDEQEVIFSTETLEYLADQYSHAERAPHFDEHSDKGYVPNMALLAAGWWLRCDQCEELIYGDDLPADASVGDSFAFCSRDCEEHARKDAADHRQRQEEASKYLLKKWPFVSHDRFWRGSPGICGCFTKDRDNVYAQVRFPGAVVGNNHFCYGCKGMWICNGDREAFYAARDAHFSNGKDVGSE